MQKRKFTFLFLIATLLSYSTFAEAALQFLPRYQGGYGTRTQQGGKDKVCSSSYKYACSGSGYAGGVGTSCNDLYTSCSCSTNYKWSGGSCVLKSCSDYGYSASKDNTKSCEEKTPRSGLTCYVCTGCDSSTYKYACSGGLNAAEQDTANKCGTNYSECSCVEHASWNSTSGKCECGSDYKAGTTSCTLKTCEDYGYSATEDTTKDCTKQTPRSGLACWNCSDCTGTLYDCGSMANASGGDGTSCGGKYPKCKCKDLYRWDNGTCKLNCTRNFCSTTTYPLTAKSAANAVSYEECTPSCADEGKRYKVAGCENGYNVSGDGAGCAFIPPVVRETLVGDILFSDMTTDAPENYDAASSSKTPIGVVFDPEKKLAASLTGEIASTVWGYNNDIAELPNYKADKTDMDGKNNTRIILQYNKLNNINGAAERCYYGVTQGTKTGDWYSPAIGELLLFMSRRAEINERLKPYSSKTKVHTYTFGYGVSGYWSSTEFDATMAHSSSWAANKSGTQEFLPIISYGNLTEPTKLPILYSDLTTSYELLAGKTPIGIVFDEENKLAVALNHYKLKWSDTNFDITGLTNIATWEEAINDMNGKNNTKIIAEYCRRYSKVCAAIMSSYNFRTSGTKFRSWYVPSAGELYKINSYKGLINEAISKSGGDKQEMLSAYFSSTSRSRTSVWSSNSDTKDLVTSSKTSSYYVRPVINYGDI